MRAHASTETEWALLNVGEMGRVKTKERRGRDDLAQLLDNDRLGVRCARETRDGEVASSLSLSAFVQLASLNIAEPSQPPQVSSSMEDFEDRRH